MAVPYAFANATTTQNLSYLDANFNYFGNAITVQATSTAMTIDSSGNVGIGTTSPTSGYKLNISDTTAKMQMTSSTGTNLSYLSWNNTGGAVVAGIESSVGGSIFVGTSAYSAVFGHGGGYPVAFATSNTERMRIDSSGNLLVGGTSVISGATFYSSSANGTCSARCTTTTAGHYYTFGHDGNDNFRVLNAANAGVYLTYGGTSWTALSDERTKNIIEPITNGVEKVNQLRAVIGSYKADSNNTRKAFLIAQDVQKVLPEAVDTTNANEFGLAYTDVIPLLVAALQEAVAKIDALETRIATLETK